MARVSDAELVRLVSATFDRTVAERAVDFDNAGMSIATAVVRAVREAGMIVIRDERDRSVDGVDQAVVERLRQGAL